MSTQPGTLLLTKIKGFPQWPTMVISEKYLPAQIRKIKPKNPPGGSSRNLRKTRGSKKQKVDPGKLICVKFLGDDEYNWVNTRDTKPLSPEQIDDFLIKKGEIPNAKGEYVGKKPAKHNKLLDAYKYARNPDLTEEAFATYGSTGLPEPKREKDDEYVESDDDDAEDDEEDDEDEEEDESSLADEDESLRDTDSSEGEEEIEDDDEEIIEVSDSKKGKSKGKSRGNARGKANGRSSGRSKVKAKGKAKAKASVKPDPGFDSDWGVDVVDNENVPAVVDLEEIPDSNQLWDEAEEATEDFVRLRREIQEILLGPLDGDDDGDDGAKVNYKKKIQKLAPLVKQVLAYDDPSVGILRATSLDRVLTIILKKPEYQDAAFVPKLRKFLVTNMGLKIEPDVHWEDDYDSDEKENENEKEKENDNDENNSGGADRSD